MERFDVVIVGAGLSGVGSAWHLQERCPGRSYVVLEARDAIGGTWDLFRYPGVRSDSDMYTLGYAFRPWREAKAIADGPSILRYVRETARDGGIEPHVRFGHRVVSASWSSDDASWNVEAELGATGERVRFACSMLLMCAGYYRYDRGYAPELPGREHFRGRIVHPQFWPEGLDLRDRRVAVIGSGATAMTLVPAMAREGAQVTMVQRSPTWVVSWPAEDRLANRLRRWLPERLAYALTRWKNIHRDVWFYRQSRKNPAKLREQLLEALRAELPPGYDVATHFTPTYDPWDQRLCLVPDSDLFEALRAGTATVVTGGIETFTERGLVMASGEEIEADIVVTATGLELGMLGGATLMVDGRPVDPAACWSYKGMMLSDVPNMVQTFGYINASWTLRADLTAEFVCRLLDAMAERGLQRATPRLRRDERDMPPRPWIVDFPAGYIRRGLHLLPRQGDRDPWRNTQDVFLDRRLIRHAPIEDGALVLDSPVTDDLVRTSGSH